MNDTDLAILVDRFMRRIHFGLQKRAPDFDRKAVGPGGGIILMTLADTGPISLNELTKRVARDKSQMTRAIRSLQDKELVIKEPSLDDGRVSMISLTTEGHKIANELMKTVSEVINEILKPISHTEIQTLKSLLGRVAS